MKDVICPWAKRTMRHSSLRGASLSAWMLEHRRAEGGGQRTEEGEDGGQSPESPGARFRRRWPDGVHDGPGMVQHVFEKVGVRPFQRRAGPCPARPAPARPGPWCLPAGGR
eukprot:gene18968-biopygen5464